MTLAADISKVQARINSACEHCGRHSSSVQLLAVSKARDAATIRAAHAAGLTAFGENYLQEAQHKQQALQDLPLEWHFIGPIQSNKTNAIANCFDWVHSISRSNIATRLAQARHGPPLQVCIQVNISDEASKSGCHPAEVMALADTIAALPQLSLRGLMAIPAPGSQPSAFQALRSLFIELQAKYRYIDTLSMGMSADMEAAISAGATIVRIGTAIFGPRPATTL